MAKTFTLSYTNSAEHMAYLRSLRGIPKEDRPPIQPRRKTKKKRRKRAVKPCIRARDLAQTKIRLAMIQKATYIDGVAALPIMYRIADDLGLPLMQLSIFIAMNHLKSFTTADAEVWGYGRFTFYKIMLLLMENGYAEVYSGKGPAKIYCVSIRGRNLFSTFQDLYHKYTLEFFDKFDKTNPARHYRPRLYDRLDKHNGKTKS